MARRKYEFRPDRTDSGILSKLYVTRQQRLSLLKWVLYIVLLLLLSIIQDVILCRVRIFGTTTALVPCGIMLLCLLEGSHTGSIFVLIASAVYLFSGSAPGYYAVPMLTIVSLGLTMFRQGYLRKGFSATMLCMAVGLLVYELAVFTAGLLLGRTTLSRLGAFCITAILTFGAAPLLYPIAQAISKIGGQTWKE